MKTKPTFKFLMVLFLLAAISCVDPLMDNTTFKINQESTFRTNQLYTSTDGEYTLQINEIGDSRCPIGVNCIWQGEVTLKGEWTDHKVKSEVEIHSEIKTSDKQPTGFNIQIVDAQPFPENGIETNPQDRVVKLLVQKK